MDKYEYNLKFDQIKSLCSEENYDAAAEIADTINWSKIRNVNALVKAGEVYEKVSRYDEAHSILLMAYDRSPIGRMIIYRLAELAIKMNDLAEAQDYYQEFVEIAPRDNLKFVLQYEILKAKGASYPELIAVLEKLKEQEYTEEWSYELAYLYHKANMVEKCIEACDELILWFGDGPYVERALELKMLYQPLSKSQEEKYRSFRMAKEGITRIHAEEMEKAGEYGHQPVNIPQVTLSAERFNTVNLQEEIAKGMQQIMNATEKTTVTDTIDSIRKAVGEIPYLQLPKESAEPEETETHIETDEEIDGSLKINFQELLDEDADGQVSMVMDEQQQLERQITGQMTIADVLEEWEKTKHAAELAMKEAEQRKLESAKARALQEAGDIMERLTGLIPKLDAGVQPVELLEEEYMSHVPTEEAELPEETTPIETAPMETAPIEAAPIETAPIETAPIEMAPTEASPIETSPIETSSIEQVENAEISEPEEPAQADDEKSDHSIHLAGLMMAGTAAAAKLAVGGIHEVEAAETAKASAIAETAKAVASGLHELHPTETDHVTTDHGTIDNGTTDHGTTDNVVIESVAEEPQYVEAEPKAEQTEPKAAETKEAEQEEVTPEMKKILEQPTIRLPEIQLPEDIVEDMASEAAEKQAKEQEEELAVKRLSPDQKAIFSYFVPVKGMEDQLCMALTGAIRHLKEDDTAKTGNIIIQGGRGCGKTVLATSIIKVLQNETGKLAGKIGKINADALNRKDVQSLLSKVEGGVLIIERAGELTHETAVKLALLLQNDKSGLLVIMEDTSKGIKKALSLDGAFASRFSEKVDVPIFTNDELVSFAKSYSSELGYEIDEMAILALYNRISNIQRLDQATTLTEVKDIVDEAIDREQHGGLRKAFSILTASRYTDDDKIVLKESVFE
ncbi:MAG: hypothetical protein K6G13_04830 [Agathobacter sp.]|uniref:tetratricopeptide repeat protein n=1 Tax=Agathobacter sp. TaxID=2021311 RepID=UPI002590312B|nr:hypothetical protein [Agathobacter sp.]MCR5677337.1 hypothetical protein [Agathobacter sp.]